jgi:predicted transcriptional regulator
MLRDIVDRAFSGSAATVALDLLKTSDLTREDLKELRDLVARKARKQ